MDRERNRQRDPLNLLGPRPSKHPALWPALIAVAYTVWFWPIGSLSPTAGLDPSWAAGLAMAAVKHMQFGPQVLFTYGPFGYLAHPVLYYSRTGGPAVAFALLAEATALFVVARALLRSLHPVPALAALWVLCAICLRYLAEVDNAELLAAAVAVLALEWLYQVASPRRDRLELLVLSAVAAGLLLVKFSAGLDALAAVGIVALLRVCTRLSKPGRDLPGAAAIAACGGGTALAAVLLLWVLAHQHLGNLASFLRGSLQLSSGYASAMSLQTPHPLIEYGGTLAFVASALVGAYWAGRTRGRGAERFGVPAVLLVAGLGLFKEGWVRPDGHQLVFFCGALVLLSAVLPHVRLWQGLCLAAACVAATAAIGHVPPRTVAAHDGPGLAARITWEVLSGGQRHGVQAQARAGLQAEYASQGLTPAQVSVLSGRSVHIDPWEASVAWAYPGIRWDPAPVFQSYAAYTTSLDRLNASFLDSPRAPEFILRQNAAIDGRDSRWESPGYMVAMACHYEQVSAGTWQVLQRVPDRCGGPSPAGSTRVAFGQEVEVPAAPPGTLLVARFRFPLPLRDRLDALVVHLPQFDVTTRSGIPVRFLPSTAGAWHLMSVPPCFDWARSLFGPFVQPSFAFAEGYPPTVPSGATIGVQFAAIPFTCPSAGAGAP